jgi:hypothetical protein
MSESRVQPVVTAHMGDAREEFCERCKAMSLVCATLHILTPQGVTRSHTYAMCPICEEDDTPEARRGR